MELAVAAAAILKALVQQTCDMLQIENVESNGAELIFEGDLDDCEDLEEIQMEDLKEALIKFEDTKPKVTDPLDEINLGSLEEPRVTYVSSLLQGDLKE